MAKRYERRSHCSYCLAGPKYTRIHLWKESKQRISRTNDKQYRIKDFSLCLSCLGRGIDASIVNDGQLSSVSVFKKTCNIDKNDKGFSHRFALNCTYHHQAYGPKSLTNQKCSFQIKLNWISMNKSIRDPLGLLLNLLLLPVLEDLPVFLLAIIHC